MYWHILHWLHKQTLSLSLSHIQMLFDSSTAEDFWKHCFISGEIAQNQQFLLLPQCFQLYLIVEPSVIEIFQIFVNMLTKSSAAELLYVGHHLRQIMRKPTLWTLLNPFPHTTMRERVEVSTQVSLSMPCRLTRTDTFSPPVDVPFQESLPPEMCLPGLRKTNQCK